MRRMPHRRTITAAGTAVPAAEPDIPHLFPIFPNYFRYSWNTFSKTSLGGIGDAHESCSTLACCYGRRKALNIYRWMPGR